MLKVSIHAGRLAERSDANQLAVLDIAYQKRAALADYIVALSTRQKGELEPGVVANYPRWSGSLWDLTARALTRVLYKDDRLPPAPKPDRRCAYATKMCAVIQRITPDERGAQLATAEVLQHDGVRGQYLATFDEDILGKRSAEFTYGRKTLEPTDLLLRAICYAYLGSDMLGKRPTLILPASMTLEGKERFDIEGLAEPARTGFSRHQANRLPQAKPEQLPLAQDYVDFLLKG